jgi:WD40 repeat protein
MSAPRSSVLEWIDQICDRYEVARLAGQRPRIDDYLGEAPEAERSALLHELLRLERAYLQDDQQRRWRRGERVSVRAYLEEEPSLQDYPDLVFELVCGEILLREERGEKPRPVDYLDLVPMHQAQLRRFFAARHLLPPETIRGLSDRVTLRAAQQPTVVEAHHTVDELPAPGGEPAPAPPGYEILSELGHGGMGVVYEARQINADRLVALKMIRHGEHAGSNELSRFRTEAEAIARLQHPHVVQVFEVGEHQGLPYFSLEFCPGGSLDKKLAGTPLPPREAAVLVEKLAQGVQAAHAARVLHRDLKPANVLLAADGTPKVTDFGLAKKLDAQGVTLPGVVMGTPSYMAPEQASGASHELGPAVDVYALGAILYECLTGRPPFRAATVLDTLRQVVSEEPVPPWQLNAQVPRDLETVCLKCLQKEANKRYASAAELADDLRRFQAGEPIIARAVGRLERAAKWVRRNPVPTVAAVAILAIALAAFIMIAISRNKALDLADEKGKLADEKGKLANEKGKLAEDKTRLAEANGRLAKEKAEEADKAQRELHAARCARQVSQLQRVAAVREHDPSQGLALLEDTQACPFDLRDFGWAWYARLCRRDRLTLKCRGPVALSSDGRVLAVTEPDDAGCMVKLWDVCTGRERTVFRGNGDGRDITCLGFSADGRILAFGSSGGGQRPKEPFDPRNEDSGEVVLWDVVAGRKIHSLKGLKCSLLAALAFSPNSRILALAMRDVQADPLEEGPCELYLWDVATGEKAAALGKSARNVTTLMFSPDGKRLVVLERALMDIYGSMRIWILPIVSPNGEHISDTRFEGGGVPVAAFAFSPDGKTLALADQEAVRLRDVATGRELLFCKERAFALAFGPDGKTLVTGCPGAVRVWDVSTGTERCVLRGHKGIVCSLMIAADSRTLVSVDQVGMLKLWDLNPSRESQVIRWTATLAASVTFSPDGKLLASGGTDKSVHMWDAETGAPALSLRGHTGTVTSVAFRPDGKAIASASDDGTVKLWWVETAKEVATLVGHDGSVNGIAFSPVGTTLASGGADHTVRVWDAHTGAALFVLEGHTGAVSALAFSPDGKALVSGGEDGLKLWDLAARKEQPAFQSDAGAVSAVAFSPDGQILASGGGERDNQGKWFGEVKLWDTATYHERATFREHTGFLRSLAFAAGGRTVATAGGDATVQLWDVVTGQPLAVLRGHAGRVSGVAFRADGTTLAVAGASQDGEGQWGSEVRLWQMAPGRERAVLGGHFGPVRSMAFAPDGKTLASVGAEENDRVGRVGVKVWELLTGRNRLSLWLPGTEAEVAFTPDGKSLVTVGEKVALWDVATGKRLWTLPGHRGRALPPVFTDGVRTLVTASDGEVKVWDVNAGQELRCFPLQEDGGVARHGGLALAPDGRSVASASSSFWVRDLTGGENRFVPGWLESLHLRAPQVMIFSPDGRSLVMGDGNGGVSLWSPATGKEFPLLRGYQWAAHLRPWGNWGISFRAVHSLAFSPDGSALAAGSEDWAIHLWTPPFGQMSLTLHGHAARVSCLAFTPDGKTLASGGQDGSLKLWNVTSVSRPPPPAGGVGWGPPPGRVLPEERPD